MTGTKLDELLASIPLLQVDLKDVFNFEGKCLDPLAKEIISESLGYALETSVRRLESVAKINPAIRSNAIENILPSVKTLRDLIERATPCENSLLSAAPYAPPPSKPKQGKKKEAAKTGKELMENITTAVEKEKPAEKPPQPAKREPVGAAGQPQRVAPPVIVESTATVVKPVVVSPAEKAVKPAPAPAPIAKTEPKKAPVAQVTMTKPVVVPPKPTVLVVPVGLTDDQKAKLEKIKAASPEMYEEVLATMIPAKAPEPVVTKTKTPEPKKKVPAAQSTAPIFKSKEKIEAEKTMIGPGKQFTVSYEDPETRHQAELTMLVVDPKVAADRTLVPEGKAGKLDLKSRFAQEVIGHHAGDKVRINIGGSVEEVTITEVKEGRLEKIG